MDYKFNIGISFGNINFNDSVDNVIKKLGKPSSVLKEEFNNTKVVMKSIEYEYLQLGISFDFRYLNDEFDSCTIFSEKIILEGLNLYDLKKKEILKLISKLSKIKIEDAFQKVDEKEKKLLGIYYDDQYIFDDIGITLWFHKSKLDDACMYLPRA